VAIWLTASAPTGYLLCDGTAVSRTTYATLFAVISTAFGAGDGSATFNLPNLKGRVPVGLDAAQTEFDVMGETGGAKTVTLDATMMPAHTHVQDAHTHVQNSHNHVQDSHNHTQNSFAPRILNSGTAGTVGVQGASAASNANASNAATTATNQVATATNQVATAVNQNATATNQSTGGGLAHANLPPYLVVNYVIKA
jgi:microcystin-dependent protein